MPKVMGKAPSRVDLAGGTLDIRPLSYVLDHKATINLGITLFAEVVVETTDDCFFVESLDQKQVIAGSYDDLIASTELPLIRDLVGAIWQKDWPALKITTQAGSPAGAGLGGSSCLAITLASSLMRLRRIIRGIAEPDERGLVQFVQDLEARLIHCPTGCQDYWGALRGGLNLISFPLGETFIETLSSTELDWIQQRILFCFSGKSRASGQNNWDIFKHVFDKDAQLISRLNQIGRLAEALACSIRKGEWREALEYSHQEWLVRRELWPAIETVETRAIDTACTQAGANFSRVCGAGGGGVMAIFCEPDQREIVTGAAVAAGGEILEARPTNVGLVLSDDS